MIKLYNTLFGLWMTLNEKIRFILVGGFNTGVSYALFVCFLWVFGQNSHQIALILAWGISSIISFITQKIYVFNTIGHWISEYIKCAGVWIIGYFVNAVLLEIFVYFSISTLIGQAIALIVIPILTYLLFKNFAFRRKYA